LNRESAILVDVPEKMKSGQTRATASSRRDDPSAAEEEEEEEDWSRQSSVPM
jgi:hypothetical protein